MTAHEVHDRPYVQSRLREEIARSRRHGRQFGLLIFEEVPGADGLHLRQKMEYGLASLEAMVRECDVVGRVFDDTIAVLLVETDARGVRDALLRMRGRLTRNAGTWRVAAYHFPEHSDAIDRLPLLTAA